MIATVICTRSLVFWWQKWGFSLVFATSFAKKFPLRDREFSGFEIELKFPAAFVSRMVMP
jgi:short subunit fatty acids transporter